jgi:hypothetical protein
MAELRDGRKPAASDLGSMAGVRATPCKSTLVQASLGAGPSGFGDVLSREEPSRSRGPSARCDWPADTMRELLGADTFEDAAERPGRSALAVGPDEDEAVGHHPSAEPAPAMELAPPSTVTATANLDVFFDLSSQIRSNAPKPNAFMLVRAMGSKNAELLDLWQGVAYYTGELPASFRATRSPGRWHWSRDGAPAWLTSTTNSQQRQLHLPI